jgi:hypothetical protein
VVAFVFKQKAIAEVPPETDREVLEDPVVRI